MGAKLWIEDGYGGMVVSGGRKALVRKIRNYSPETGAGSSTKPQRSDEKGVEMGDADVVALTVPFEEPSRDGSPKTKVVALSDIINEEAEDADGNQPSIINFIDAAGRFLEGFLAKENLSKDFIKCGRPDVLLEFYTVPSLPYDFATSQANQMMSRALQVCSENNPSVTVTATLKHVQKATDQLQPFLQHDKKGAFFPLLTDRKAAILSPRPQGGIPAQGDHRAATSSGRGIAEGIDSVQVRLSQYFKPSGTKVVNNLVTVHSLCDLLQELYSQPLFNVWLTLSISMQAENEAIVSNIGALHQMCV